MCHQPCAFLGVCVEGLLLERVVTGMERMDDKQVYPGLLQGQIVLPSASWQLGGQP